MTTPTPSVKEELRKSFEEEYGEWRSDGYTDVALWAAKWILEKAAKGCNHYTADYLRQLASEL